MRGLSNLFATPHRQKPIDQLIQTLLKLSTTPELWRQNRTTTNLGNFQVTVFWDLRKLDSVWMSVVSPKHRYAQEFQARVEALGWENSDVFKDKSLTIGVRLPLMRPPKDRR